MKAGGTKDREKNTKITLYKKNHRNRLYDIKIILLVKFLRFLNSPRVSLVSAWEQADPTDARGYKFRPAYGALLIFPMKWF